MSTAQLPLFYRRPRPLNPADHRGLNLELGHGYGFTRQAHSVPLLAAELPNACRHLPVVFSAGDSPLPMAVLGLREGENLCVDEEGQWRSGSYIPAYVRRYPFIFLEDVARNELTLCVDEAAPMVLPAEQGQAFFAPNGEPSAVTQSALSFCRDYQAHHQLTIEFGAALKAQNLLFEQRADVQTHSGERLSLNGFQVVDEARFKQLPDAVFLEWRAKGWLPLVYAHLLSIGSWSGLIDRLA